MASFKFDDESDDLDLSTGGDAGAPKQPARTPASRPNPAPQKSATPNRAADLLQRQRNPATQRPAAPARPQAQPTQPAAQNFPPSRPAAPQVQQPPIVQPQAPVEPTYVPEPAQQTRQEPEAPQYSQPANEQPYVAPVPAPQAPAYQPPAPTYEDLEDDFAPLPVERSGFDSTPRLSDRDRYANAGFTQTPAREPSFMREETSTSVPRASRPAPEPMPDTHGNGERVQERKNPIAAFFDPFFGRGSNQNGSKSGGRKPPTKRNGSSGGGNTNSGSNFAGARQKVLLIRIGVFVIAGIVLLAGARALFFPNKGPTYDEVAGVAKQATNYTAFPKAMGEGVALGFTSVLLNYDPNADSAQRDARSQVLSHYVGSGVSDNIDLALAQDQTGKKQTITEGPYLYGEKNIDDTHMVVTVLAQINGSKWVYMDIPLVYQANSNTVSVSNLPTFVTPETPSTVDSGEYTADWTEDKTVEDAFSATLSNYLNAWSNGTNQDLVDQFLVPDNYVAPDGSKGPTQMARVGLKDSFQFVGVNDLSVSAADATNGTSQNVRLAQFTLTWEDPDTHLLYSQSYRARIVYQSGRWLIQDIGTPLEITE